MVVKREKAGKELTVTVKLTQDEEWLSDRYREVYFYPSDTIAVMKIHRSKFDADVTESGCIVARVEKVDGYDVSKAKALVLVISVPGSVVTLSLNRAPNTFAEDGEHATQQLVARMMLGMPRGVTVVARIDTRGKESFPAKYTATAGEDFETLEKTLIIAEDEYELEDSWWVARTNLSLSIFDDDMREGTETFELGANPPSDQSGKARFLNADGSRCWGRCRLAMHITDEEDIPALDLSVSADEIMEEGETSSTATVATTNGKSFATDQVMTFQLGGTATEGDDYVLSPRDADQEEPDYQFVMPAESKSVDVTLKAMSDDVDDPDEKIEVSAMLGDDEIGDMKAVRIMNQRLMAITLAANRDTIIAGMEYLELTVTLEEPADEDLVVTVRLTQEQNWLRDTSVQLNFAAGSAIHELGFHESTFSSAVTESGNLAATVDSVSGYDTGDASVTVFVVSQEGPAMKVFFSHEAYRFTEDREDPFVILVAEAASGMPRGATVPFSVSSRRGTATSPGDYAAMSRALIVPEEDFTFEGGLWQTQVRLPLSLVDDEVWEGTESFDLLLERSPDSPSELQFADFLGAPCQGECLTPVEITDDEDIPEFELSVSEDEIMEEDESSSIAIVSITNGKSFATDQAVTFTLGGDAIPGHDYRVTPADADEELADHQATLSAGSSSVEATFTAVNDEREEGDEEIRFAATHDGDAIGSGAIRIIDRFPGPRVEITFEGVDPPRDKYDAGIATGPFTARITFSERVEGFEQEDIRLETHSGTTVDSTNIGVLLWNYTEVRVGLEYTVEVMPEQNGRLWTVVSPGAATSVKTGDGNQLGANSLQIELPEDRMMVAPTELTVVEEDTVGGRFMVVLTSEPTEDTVKVTLSGTKGTALKAVAAPSLTFVKPFWTLGRVVTVTAGADANTADETVTLTLTASGGGYDGQTVDVVVTVRDNDAAYVRGMSEDEALALVEDATPEAAAAALFGKEGLSEAQLDALDLLGNANGSYDLGDMLSWIDRCRRGGARCGAAPSSTSESIPVAVAAGLGGGTSHRRRRVSSGTRGPVRNRRIRRRSGAARYGLALLLAATMTLWACADDVVRAPSAEADPGFLAVQLTVPSGARDIAAMLVVEGPGVDSVQAPGFELFQSDASSSTGRRIIVSGALSTGAILEFRVPDRGEHARYRVRLLQVAGEDYTLRDLADYTAVISR